MDAVPSMNEPFRGGTKVGKAAPDGNEGGIVLKSIDEPKPNRHWLFCNWAKDVRLEMKKSNRSNDACLDECLILEIKFKIKDIFNC
jgi:hypothetical protein